LLEFEERWVCTQVRNTQRGGLIVWSWREWEVGAFDLSRKWASIME